MKVFYARVTDSEFTKVGNTWTSPVFDLYDNDSYTNYSTVKSDYGLNILGDGTWTGSEIVSPGVTDSGYVDGDRFVDTTGRIDIVSYTFSPGDAAEGFVTADLDVYVSTDEDEWYSPAEGVVVAGEIGIEDSPRYAYFAINIDNPRNFALEGELLVRVEIDQPVMAPLYRRTRVMLDKLPEWMAMREADYQPATPLNATPSTVGAAFVNIAGGQWLDQIVKDMKHLDLQRHVSTVDQGQIAWVRHLVNVPKQVWSVEGDGVVLSRAFDQEDFYEALDGDDIFWWDEDDRSIYMRASYDEVLVNGEDVTASVQDHHIWNWIDDIGLMVDLERLNLEENDRYLQRVLDVHANKPGVGVENFKKTLRRELDIWQVYGATPNPDYLGATPTILEIEDIERDAEYIEPDGMPTEKFIRLVKRLADEYPSTWGYFYWNQAFWDFGGPKHESYSSLPMRYDATPLLPADTQSGVGYGNDLYVYRPDVITGAREFDATLKLRGLMKETRTEYTPVEFVVEVFGRADTVVYANPEVSAWVTLEVVTAEATPRTLYYSVELTHTSDADILDPTLPAPSTGLATGTTLRIFDADGYSRLRWMLTETESIIDAATPEYLHMDDVANLTLHSGRYDFDLSDFVDTEEDDTFEAWFSSAPASVLDYDTIVPITIYDLTTEPFITFRSRVIESAAGEWESERVAHVVTLNGVAPNQTTQSVILPLHTISWPIASLAATPNMRYVVQIVTLSEEATPQPGAYALDDAGNQYFIPITYLYLDDDNVWDGDEKELAAGTAQVVFSTGDGGEATPTYPIEGTVWVLFEATGPTYSGTVDENGPWRNGAAPPVGSNNYTWRVVEPTRADFDLPESADYRPTWMGVETSDGSVIAWLDNNTVIPYGDDSSTAPANAIDESLDAGAYGFESFALRVRMRPDVAPEWNPKVNSGTFFSRQDEYYLYADKIEEQVTYSGGTSSLLAGVAHQGAPIVVYTDEATPQRVRQVAFSDATPTLSLQNTETIAGNGTNNLYLAYPDVYDVTVVEHDNGSTTPADTTAATNVLVVHDATSVDKLYDVTYTLRRSFYADMNYNDEGVLRTRLVFDEPGDYIVYYEGATYETATPVDLPLSPLYTTLEEGFIFITHEEYPLDSVQVFMSPTKLIDNGRDYAQVTIRSYDSYGNPKPFQSFVLHTTDGVFADDTITTDSEGFGYTTLKTSSFALYPDTEGVYPGEDQWPTIGSFITEGTVITGQITVHEASASPALVGTVDFTIQPPWYHDRRLVAVPSVDEIPADAHSQIMVMGKLEGPDFSPLRNVILDWRKARTLYELFHQPHQGSVTTDENGVFVIGPMTTSATPGYWFLSVEADSEGDEDPVGDVVFWNEYPTSAHGPQAGTQLPWFPIQNATPNNALPHYRSPIPNFPVSYDETYDPGTMFNSGDWEPPKWYSIPWYTQYQSGMIAATPDVLVDDYIDIAHPPWRHI